MAADLPRHKFHAENAEKFAKTWADESHRNALLARLAKTVENGQSVLDDEEFAGFVREGCLTSEQVAECYYELRQCTNRPEGQWRTEFEAIFPDYRLPPMVSQAVLDECVDVLVIGIIERHPQTVENALKHAASYKIDLHAIKGIAPESFQARYPVFCDETDDDAMDLIQLAEKARNEKVIKLIKGALGVEEKSENGSKE